MDYRLGIFAVLVIAGFDCARPCWAVGDQPVFEASIQPIFAAKCGKCHSAKVQKGSLDLSSIDALRRGGESGEALVGDTIEESLLWQQVDDGEMPPADQPPLTDDELAMIRRWIISGAASEIPMQQARTLTQHDVLPIVLLRCTTCHGPRLKQGGLDLRTRSAMLAGGKSGPALVPGDADASLMIQRIESEACPPRELLLKFFVRRPPRAETAKLREWIDAGAPEVNVPPDVATTAGDPLVTDQDRRHWAFQPPRSTSQFQSIDQFVQAKLREQGLDLSPAADRDTLIRRAYYDLLGLPPSLAEARRWQESRDPHWYAQMIDHLLASPHYGERWGRYWLDLAGYADSEGGISADPIRPVAWKYRDYVIDALNHDKPYDRFLLEQIAGDELIDYETAAVVSEEMVQNLTATGFLRMGIDETGSRTMNFVPERLKVISDAITVVSSGVMGLTMECARCHSHKYDPIPHRDYYRFKAIFQGALDEHDWSSFKTRTLSVATPQHRQQVAQVNPPLTAEIKQLAAQQKKLMGEITINLLRHHYPEQSESDHRETLIALKVADNNRTLPQKILVERLQKAELLPDRQQPESVIAGRRKHEQIQAEIERIKRSMVPPVTIRALWDFGRPSPTYVLRRGEHDKPGSLVGPGVPSVLTDGKTPFVVQPPFVGGSAKTGRRLALARWLVHSDHPLTSRVMINRIWYHHFGTGLVKDLENFGLQGERPSHPELLDWLAVQFVNRGWSIKQMHRLIMNSRTYRQSSRITAERLRLDPTNRLLSRSSLRRLDAEALRDSLLLVAGKLDDTPGGIPDTVSVNRDGLVSVNQTDGGGWRRSVYLQYRRTEIPTMMDTFDYPQMGPNCVARNVSTVSPQALMLINNGHVRELAAAFADNVQATVAKQREQSLAAKVDAVYRIALARPPAEQERELGIKMLQQLETAWLQSTRNHVVQPVPRPGSGKLPEAGTLGSADTAQQRALVTYCHTILNSAAFLYID